ncbi:unnamed protein product [Symbiodinium pilosum]|uniref:Fibrous sheath-interacting protein 1 n=1 Tax=Symbiodinium pilosum TaxID=2952 RepID=A0A812JKW8_SYMPI|nr:unnamed protein product [Symbiodinium pilosum]
MDRMPVMTMGNVPPVRKASGAEEAEQIFEDPYNLEAILAIDDKLAQLIPESEWEAKSIRSLRAGSEISAGHSQFSKPSVQSSALSCSALPGEQVLREQYEDRENRKALHAIDDRISQLQDEMRRRASEQLQPDQLQQLLLQAAAAQPVPGVDDKVLSLQAGALDVLAQRQPQHPQNALEAAGPLSKAREILARLEQSKDDLDDAVAEATSSRMQVEDSVRELEEQSSANPMTDMEDVAHVEDDRLAEMTTWATKLEDLAKEASDVATNGVPSAHGALPAIDVDAFVKGDWESANLLMIPTLSSAAGGTGPGSPHVPLVSSMPSEEMALEEEGDVLDDLGFPPGMEASALGSETGDAVASDYNLSDDDMPVFLPVAEIVEPAKALDMELPEGHWTDEDLEKLSSMMDAHFADAKMKGEHPH